METALARVVARRRPSGRPVALRDTGSSDEEFIQVSLTAAAVVWTFLSSVRSPRRLQRARRHSCLSGCAGRRPCARRARRSGAPSRVQSLTNFLQLRYFLFLSDTFATSCLLRFRYSVRPLQAGTRPHLSSDETSCSAPAGHCF